MSGDMILEKKKKDRNSAVILILMVAVIFLFWTTPAEVVIDFNESAISVTRLPAGSLATASTDTHNQLNGLEWSVAGHTFDENLDAGAYNVSGDYFLGQWNGSSLYLPLAGGTMTGTLNMQGDILPSGTRDLGAVGQAWKELYLQNLFDNNGNFLMRIYTNPLIQFRANISASPTNTLSIGTPTNKWKHIYYGGTLYGNTINVTGDATIGGNVTIDNDRLILTNSSTEWHMYVDINGTLTWEVN